MEIREKTRLPIKPRPRPIPRCQLVEVRRYDAQFIGADTLIRTFPRDRSIPIKTLTGLQPLICHFYRFASDFSTLRASFQTNVRVPEATKRKLRSCGISKFHFDTVKVDRSIYKVDNHRQLHRDIRQTFKFNPETYVDRCNGKNLNELRGRCDRSPSLKGPVDSSLPRVDLFWRRTYL